VKSIRLSLLVYFFALLAVALGAVSVLVYQHSQRILEANEKTRKQLLQDQAEKAAQEQRNRLDIALLHQAQALAAQAQYQYYWTRLRSQPWAPLGALGVTMDPRGSLLAPVLFASAPLGPWSEYLRQRFATEIQFNEDLLPHDDDLQGTLYFQINTEGGRSWGSRSLGGRSFSFDPVLFAEMKLLESKPDETDLGPGTHVRRVTLKAPASRVAFYVLPRPPFPEPRPRSQPHRRNLEPQKRESNAPAILIQFAVETTDLDQKLAEQRDISAQKLASAKDESAATLAGLRNRLLLISLVTFAATVFGGVWLVRLGLSPLRRLSEAVSLISVKDFRLPFDESKLPAELRPIEERLVETLELLKRAFAREKQAAADISHELRTPLAALLTTIEVGLRKQRNPEEYRELLEDCHAAGKQMSQLVERLLALARLDAGVDTLRPHVVDVATLSEQCANLVRPLAEARGLSLQVKRNGPAQLYTDPDKLREVITNLLHNAIEYNKPHGRVDLSLGQQNGHLWVEVRDTGIGIAPAARTQIFERFYRADSSRHAEGLHAGLGLAIVKGYVDLMGGTITVESTEGQGSSFRLELPTQRPARVHG
jgi:heavy metal sensor kinase